MNAQLRRCGCKVLPAERVGRLADTFARAIANGVPSDIGTKTLLPSQWIRPSASSSDPFEDPLYPRRPFYSPLLTTSNLKRDRDLDLIPNTCPGIGDHPLAAIHTASRALHAVSVSSPRLINQYGCMFNRFSVGANHFSVHRGLFRGAGSMHSNQEFSAASFVYASRA
jgi:hypothetical protein